MEQLVRNKVLSYLLNNKIPLNEYHFFKVLMYGLKSSSEFFFGLLPSQTLTHIE